MSRTSCTQVTDVFYPPPQSPPHPRITDITIRDRSDSQRSLATCGEYRHAMSVASSAVYSPDNAYTYVHSPAYSDVSPQGPPAREFPGSGVASPQLPATVEQLNREPTTAETPLSRASGNEAVIQELVQYMLDGYDGAPLDCDMERELNNNCAATTVVNGH